MLEVLAAFLAALLSTPIAIRIGKALKIEGVDVHKPWRPRVPKTGGLALIAGSSLAILIYIVGSHGDSAAVALLISSLIAASIGLVEDVREEIDPRLKPLLLILAALPILFLGTFTPRPVIPFLGRSRLYKVYPVMILLAYPIVCNAVNSLDVLNGSMIATSAPFFAVSAVIFYLRGDYPSMIFSLIMLASLLAVLPYNRYPAKVFLGNSGSLFTGAAIASIAIIGRIEIAAIITLLPQIMNEMHVIFSLGGIKSAKQAKSRPVKIENGKLKASRDKSAPITLLRMLCAEVLVDERQAVRAMAFLASFTALLGLITDLVFVEGFL